MSIMLQELQGEIKSLIYSDMDHVYIVESLEKYQTPVAHEIIISVLEKMLTYGSSKIILLLNEFIKKVNWFGDKKTLKKVLNLAIQKQIFLMQLKIAH